MKGRFLLDDAAGRHLRRGGVALHHVHALHQHAVFGAQHAQDFALLALVATGDHHHLVALLDLKFRCHHSTSGAKEMIFMKFLARSSRVTGPKIRVPIGSPCLLISTAALLSKRIVLPSLRRISFAVRTIRSEEHTSELQSLMRISYAVFCLKKKKQQKHL